MRTHLLVILSCCALFSHAPEALADAAQARQYAAQRALQAAGLQPAHLLNVHDLRARAALESAALGAGDTLYVTTASDGLPHSDLRPVVIDGVRFEMNPSAIRDLVDAGAFTVVYPGTDIPWHASAGGREGYPPAWR